MVFAFVLAVCFQGSEPFLGVNDIYDICCKEGKQLKELKKRNINNDIKILALAKKAKPDPSEGGRVIASYDQNNQPYLSGKFRTAKERDAFVKEIRQSILEAKQDYRTMREFALPRVGINYPGQRFGLPEDDAIELLQIVDGSSVLGKFLPEFPDRDPVLFRVGNTLGLSDSGRLKLDEPIVFDGSYNYINTLGASRTVRAFRILTSDEVDELTKMAKRLDPEIETRAWVSEDGKHSTRAKLISFDLFKVKLEKEDGSIVELLLSKLSKEDQKHVARELGLDPL